MIWRNKYQSNKNSMCAKVKKSIPEIIIKVWRSQKSNKLISCLTKLVIKNTFHKMCVSNQKFKCRELLIKIQITKIQI
jgi:hypothetical protein